MEVPDSAIVLTKEEGDKFYQKKLIPGAGISIDEDGNISVTANTDVFKPVASLPDAPAEEDKGKIFLVENSSEEEGNFYDEYVWTVNDEHPDGYWEKIGSTKIDLSSYLTKEEAAEKYQPIASLGDPYVKKSELPDLSDYMKVEEVDGKKVVTLPMDTQLMGSIDNAIYALLSLRKYAQEEGADLIQVEVGTTSFHLNLNTFDNITYDTPSGKKTIATLDDLKDTYVLNGLWGVEEGSDQSVIEAAIGSWDGLVSAIKSKQLIVDYNQSTNIYHSVIYATATSAVAVNLIMIEGNTYRIYQVQNVNESLALGVTERKLVFNTDLDSYVKKEEGKGLSSNDFTDEEKAKLEGIDGNSIPWRISLPIRTPLNKVFEESEILGWFRVESVAELKQLFNTRNLYLKYGIILTGKPMYYNMQIHYAAFESDTQVKLIWIGLDTSNDAATRYTFIINLDGTVIENNSNVSLKLEPLASSESQDSYVVVDELTEDYVVPANPEKKEKSYEIHVGSEVHNISAAEGVKWQNNSTPEVQADHIYVVSVINNLAVWGEF